MYKSIGPKIVIIAGNRPEIIKLSELVKSLDNVSQNEVVYTGQHYSQNMSDTFLKELGVRVNCNLNSYTSQLDILVRGIENYLSKSLPTHVLVYGDTNSSLAGAIAARNTNCKLIHLEAGLRCFDQTMTEELNRIKIDSLSTYHFAPTELNRVFLKFENFPDENISVTGNLIVDVCQKYSRNLVPRANFLPSKYILLTLHRQENVDDPKNLKILMTLLSKIEYPIVFPVHPRTRRNLTRYNLHLPANVLEIDPVGYREFLSLIQNSILAMTDSGGLQEEAVILKKPCITLRNSTERQETLLIKANTLFYAFNKLEEELGSINAIIEEMLSVPIRINPYGDCVTKRTLSAIARLIEDGDTNANKESPITIKI
jgi:UDP-N-acetylglucosamine 2-epimerase (non-hydrolysing)